MFGNDSDPLGSVNKDAITGQKRFRFVDVHHDFLQELAALLDPTGRQVPGETADAGIAGGKSSSRQ